MSNKHKLVQRVRREDGKNKVRHFSLSALTIVSIQREIGKMGVQLTGAESAKAVDELLSKGRFRIRNTTLEKRKS